MLIPSAFFRVWCLVEMVAALQADKPVLLLVGSATHALYAHARAQLDRRELQHRHRRAPTLLPELPLLPIPLSRYGFFLSLSPMITHFSHMSHSPSSQYIQRIFSSCFTLFSSLSTHFSPFVTLPILPNIFSGYSLVLPLLSLSPHLLLLLLLLLLLVLPLLSHSHPFPPFVTLPCFPCVADPSSPSIHPHPAEQLAVPVDAIPRGETEY